MADCTKRSALESAHFRAHGVVVCKSPEDFPQFLHITGQFDSDGEPMTTTTCGVGSLLARRYGDLRAVFAAYLPQSIKSKPTSALPTEVDVLLRAKRDKSHKSRCHRKAHVVGGLGTVRSLCLYSRHKCGWNSHSTDSIVDRLNYAAFW